MKKYRLITVLVLLWINFAVGQSKSRPDKAPLPDKVTSAKTVFLLNQTEAKLGDAVYRELKKWNRWELVTDRSKADLLVVVSQQETVPGVFSTATANTTTSAATATGLAVPVTDKGWFLHILDARTGEDLWAVKARLSFWGKTWNGMAKQLVGDIKDRM